MSIAKGADAVLHGMRTKVLVDDQGEPDAVHSIASGLDYPGVGPQHAYFDQVGRVEYVGITDDQVLDAFLRLATLPILERDPAFNRRFIEVNEHIVELVQSGDRQAASDYLQVQLMEQAEAIIEMIEKINNGAV